MCHGQCQSTNILNHLLNHKLKSKDWSDDWKVYMSTYVNYKSYIGLYSSWECLQVLQVLEKNCPGKNKLQWNLNNCYIIWPAIFDTFGSKVLILLIPHRSLIFYELRRPTQRWLVTRRLCDPWLSSLQRDRDLNTTQLLTRRTTQHRTRVCLHTTCSIYPVEISRLSSHQSKDVRMWKDVKGPCMMGLWSFWSFFILSRQKRGIVLVLLCCASSTEHTQIFQGILLRICWKRVWNHCWTLEPALTSNIFKSSPRTFNLFNFRGNNSFQRCQGCTLGGCFHRHFTPCPDPMNFTWGPPLSGPRSQLRPEHRQTLVMQCGFLYLWNAMDPWNLSSCCGRASSAMEPWFSHPALESVDLPHPENRSPGSSRGCKLQRRCPQRHSPLRQQLLGESSIRKGTHTFEVWNLGSTHQNGVPGVHLHL